jgi:hypothetical protein
VLGLLTTAPLGAAEIDASPDVTVQFDSVIVADDQLLRDPLGSGLHDTIVLAGVPASADVIGYHPLGGGDVLLALDTTVELPSSPSTLVARAGDVVRFDGSEFTLELDADAAGIPRGVRTNAVGGWAGDLLLSFDSAVELGGGLVARRQDVVRFDGTSFILLFDGAAEGVPSGLGIDGVDVQFGSLNCGNPNVSNRLMLSFDASGTVGGIDFDDADVLGFSSGTWTLE